MTKTKITRYWLTLDGINWREITRKQGRVLMGLTVSRMETFPSMRRYELDKCVSDSQAVGAPQLHLVYG